MRGAGNLTFTFPSLKLSCKIRITKSFDLAFKREGHKKDNFLFPIYH